MQHLLPFLGQHGSCRNKPVCVISPKITNGLPKNWKCKLTFAFWKCNYMACTNHFYSWKLSPGLVLLTDDCPCHELLISLFFNVTSTFLCNLGQHNRYRNKPVCIISPKIANGFAKKLKMWMNLHWPRMTQHGMHTDTSTVENSAEVFVLLADDCPFHELLINLFFSVTSPCLCHFG
jgi:hypothetical protein